MYARRGSSAVLSTLPILGLFAASGCGSFGARSSAGLPANFGTVEAGLYRGAQPRGAQFDALARLGVRTIVKLNDSSLTAERAACERLGITLVYLPLAPRQTGTAPSCDAVCAADAALANPDLRPLYVHCRFGKDRTGFAVGLLRLRQGWGADAIRAEARRFGHTAARALVYPNLMHTLAAGLPDCHGCAP